MRLNLKKSIVDDYYNKKSKRLSKILSKMEPMESWVLDSNKSVADAIVDMSNALESAEEYKITENSESILKILAYLSCSKALYFMTWLDNKFQKDLSIDFIRKAEELSDNSAEFAIHVERLDTFNKINLIGSIFSERRLQRIISTLEQIKEKENKEV